MNQMKVEGKVIQEYSGRSMEIQNDIEELLAMLAIAHRFNWLGPLHDLVRRLMNEVAEFKPEGGEDHGGG